MASLRDVAERAGVSVATASRVASGSAAVRDATRVRVERAMRDLLYVAPARESTSAAIGLLVPEFGNPIFAALAHAMETQATAAGLASILCNTGASAAREVNYVHMLLERRVDGMIFISPEVTDVRGEHAHYRQLLERGANIVFVNGAAEAYAVTSVSVDERAAGRIATEHLVELGHRRIGFVAGETYALPTREKLRGRNDALRAAGLEPNGLVAHAPFTVEGGERAFMSLFRRPRGRRPTAVISSNDLMAIGVMRAAAHEGVSIPDEVSVVGFDGIDATTWMRPALTTVAQPIEEIAETAVAALLSQAGGQRDNRPSYLFRPRLRLGGTTAPPHEHPRSSRDAGGH